MVYSKLSPSSDHGFGGRRWFGVGESVATDAGAAAREATEAAVQGSDARLVVVFCSDDYDLEALVAAVNHASGGVPLIGCSTAGEITGKGPRQASVVVTALGGPGFSVSVACGRNASSRLRDAGADAAACISAIEERPHRVLVLLSDGLAGDQRAVVAGAYGVAGAAVPLVGGCAGDGLKMKKTFQLYGDEVLSDAVVGAAIGSEAPLGIGVRHGWQRVGDPVLVTDSYANRVLTLDDGPALDVYLDRLKPPSAVHRDHEAFTDFALTHPLGISRRTGEDQIRFIAGCDFEDRSLALIAEMPQGGMAWFMEGDRTSVLGATEAACSAALAPLGGRRPLGLMAFDCIARRGVLGDDGIRSEVSVVADCAWGAPVSGLYTYGEIARTHGMTGFHNQTLVVLSVG